MTNQNVSSDSSLQAAVPRENAPRILRLPAVKARTGLSRSSIYLRVAEKRFPQPIPLGGRAVGWLEEEINDWLRERIQTRRGPVNNQGEIAK